MQILFSEAGLTWYDFAVKGKYDPRDPFLRFIAVWIAFNTLYESNLPNATEQDQIRAIAQNDFFNVCHADLLAKSPEYQTSIQSLSRNGVMSLRKGKRYDIKDPMDLQSVLLCIYQVRCNLFHGGKHRNDERDQLLSTAGYIVIGSLLEYQQSGKIVAPNLLSRLTNAAAI